MRSGAKVVIAKIKVLPYSIRHMLSYQVAVSYPLPSPSTLLGALVRALIYTKECENSEKCLERAKNIIAKIRVAVTQTCKLSKSTIVLSRLRGIMEEERLPASINEVPKFRDAMLREYMFTIDGLLILVIPKNSENLSSIVNALYLVDRLGDSESFVTIEDVSVAEAVESTNNYVNVVVKANTAIGGNYIVMRGHDEEDNQVDLAFPVARGPGMAEDYYVSSPIKVATHVLCTNTCTDKVCFPGLLGGEW